MEVTVRNSDIAKFGTREERKTKLTDYINRRGPRTHEKTTEAKILSKGLIASLTSKDAVLKEVRDCIIRGDEERLKALNPYLHSYWRDLHVTGGCV